MTPVPSRPLSPHLSIYRMTITMAMSIAHRITGIVNYGAGALLALYLVALAAGEGTFNAVAGVYGSWFGRFVLFLVTFSVFHHMLGGIRHLIWDTIHGLDPENRFRLAWATIIGSLGLTVFFWLVLIAT